MNQYHKLKESQTLSNLTNALHAESLSLNRYSFYAESAGREGQKILEELFLEITHHESGHSKIFYDYLASGTNGSIVTANVQTSITLGSISQNLTAASKIKYELWSNLYPFYASVAQKDGFDTIARSFTAIASIEKEHDRLLRSYLEKHNTITLYHTDFETIWQCVNCGYLHIGTTAPDLCPACLHPREFYKSMMIPDSLTGQIPPKTILSNTTKNR